MLIACSILIFASFPTSARTYHAHVHSGTTLREALSLARDGDTIRLMPGIHIGSMFEVKHSITVIGHKDAVVDGQSSGGSIFIVTADNVAFRNLTIRNVAVSYVDDHAAIKILKRKGADIEGCRIENGFFAIYLSNSADCRIANNVIIGTKRDETAAGNGIHAWTCRNILVTGNRVYGHRDGIYFEFMRRGTVLNNHSETNARYGLHFMFSDSCSYRNNIFEANGAGVAVMYTKHIEMIGNTFINNWGPTSYGLLLKDIADGYLSNNLFDHNSVAIHAEGLNRILFTRNHFIRNGYGLRILGACEDNTVTENMFDGNTFDVTTHSRESSNFFRRNYWSSYEGYDLDRNGIGDVPHHPVRLYSLLVEQMPSSVILMHTAFINILDLTERVVPTITPEALVDAEPLMRPLPLRK